MKNKMKNYIVFINDHSGSMRSIAHAALEDYNANMLSVVEAANTEKLDTIVSVIGVGLDSSNRPVRQVVVSNPHVLRPMTSWPTPGGTPLYDCIADAVNLMKSVPDYDSPDVSFLLMVTTDGMDEHSKAHNKASLARVIEGLNKDGRWTIVCRIPKRTRHYFNGLNIPEGNIQEWDTTVAGMRQATAVQKEAVKEYFRSRATGSTSSTTFYANAGSVDVSKLQDVSKEISLYVVPQHDNGIEIRDFILRHRMEYLKGAAFYQLTKTEARVSHTKMILIRDRSNGKIYAGKDARSMIGLPNDRNARLHPGDHKNYDIFIQSESVNRKLVGGTGVLYWAKIGVQFTEADLAYLKPKVAVEPAVVQLPKVEPTNRPTPSPIPKTPKQSNMDIVDGKRVMCFNTRQEARNTGKSVKDSRAYGVTLSSRWFVFI